ncbi:MAG: GNAT family N-acetyltransferase [Hyphomicrobiaceae bacterium]
MTGAGFEDCGTTSGGDTVFLRNMVPNDIPDLATEFANMDPWLQLGMGYDHLARFFATSQSSRARKVVVIDRQLSGLVITEGPWLFGTYLKFFGIFKDKQARGIGSVLLHHLIDQAREQGVRNYWVMTSAFNHDAVRLYQRHGFARVALLPDLIVTGDDEILMRQLL